MYEKGWVEKLNAALAADLPPNTEILFQLQRSAVTKKVIKATPLLLEKTAKVTGDMLSNASVQVENNKPYVSMTFNEIGTKAFGDVTSVNVGNNLAIILDGVVESDPVIQVPITDGRAQITLHRGGYQELHDEASALVLILKEGALPASLSVASKNIIGPSLGRDSIHAGLKSLWIASLVVVGFMLLYYKLGGLIANVALLLNVVYIFAALALFKASLTLPGMAGIVLTMGMAVDANVIIFERMREERLLGRPAATIVASGYQHAMSAIVDGNLTTLIAGVVLFQFGTGPIKGFAVTLMIGILTTMLTAIVYTRTIYEWQLQSLNVKKLSF
jgi:protein-export membrane protein SecD